VTIARGFKESESKREVSPDSLQDTFVNLQDRIQKIERTLDLAGDAARDFVDMLNKGPASKEMLSKFLNSFRHEKTLDDLLS
jgi:cupin superfamily acireductone dioxygenase involved in methionine salvage